MGKYTHGPLRSPALAQLCITEFMADNETGLVNEEGKLVDWIEIHSDYCSREGMRFICRVCPRFSRSTLVVARMTCREKQISD